MSKHPGKTAAQRRALDAIGCGNHSPLMAKATRNALLAKGLIFELTPHREPCGPFTLEIKRFDMPTWAHIQWCEAMSATE